MVPQNSRCSCMISIHCKKQSIVIYWNFYYKKTTVFVPLMSVSGLCRCALPPVEGSRFTSNLHCLCCQLTFTLKWVCHLCNRGISLLPSIKVPLWCLSLSWSLSCFAWKTESSCVAMGWWICIVKLVSFASF